MSLYGYKPKTKPALWTQVERVAALRRELAAAQELMKSAKALLKKSRKRSAALRKRAEAAFSARKRGKAAAKPRQRLKPRSSAMAARMKDYKAAKGLFLLANRYCAGCNQPSRSMELHHTRGRLGPLLTDERFWLPLCSECHRWVHDNIDAARERNLIAQPGDWNRTT